MTIKQALIFGIDNLKKSKIPTAALDAEILLLCSLNKFKKTKKNLSRNFYLKNVRDKSYLFLKFVGERKNRKPIAYIIKNKEFFGLDFFVNCKVLIPRPETELIVESAISYLSKIPAHKFMRGINIIDIGTGSGCIAITLAKYLSAEKKFCKNKKIKICAVDISKEAIKIAKLNAKKHRVKNKINFLKGNLLEPIQKLILDKKISEKETAIIIANLPYLNENQYKNSQKEIKKYEPKIALCGGKNGLECIKNLLEQLGSIKFSNCVLWLEIDPSQANKIINLSKKYFRGCEIKIIKDLSGLDRILKIKFLTSA
jgi:release factor glutamine methyltransferase